MSIKYKNAPFVQMTQRELKAYLKDHPNAKYVTLSTAPIIHCDMCGKRINKDKQYWMSGHIDYFGNHARDERYQICSDECAAKVIRLFADKCAAQTDEQPPSGVSFLRFNDPREGKD